MFNQEIINQFKKYAVDKFPNEACGFIIDGVFEPKENVSDYPMDNFVISHNEYPINGNLQAILHSHPRGVLQPSADDIEGQIRTAVPWGLVSVNQPAEGVITTSDILFWGDGIDITPLVGRRYRHGPSGSDGAGDCYALIKDYYKYIYDINLPEYPRNEDWFKTGENLYVDNFEKAGFRRISKTEVQDGDIFLAQIRSKVSNHGGIYLGNNLVLHHIQNQLSVREPITRWVNFITHYLRYNNAKEKVREL